MPQTATWAERAWLGLLRVAPLRTYTRLIRVVSGIPLPRPLRGPVFGTLAARMGMDLEEAAGTVPDYRCFRDLFARPLTEGRRPLDGAEEAVISPVDGCVAEFGVARRGGMIQAKGIEYPLADLVASADLARKLDGGCFVTLYLRPRDYHRIHCPIEGTLVGLRHIAGSLFPVQPLVVKRLDGLYVRNERVIFEIESGIGPVAMVCVAAAGVGNISTPFGGAHSGASIARGEEVARFNLGSTVIAVFPPGRVRLAPLARGQEIRMGQRLATVGSRDERRPIGD